MSADPYASRRYLDDYLLLHYGRPRDLCPFRCVPSEALQFHMRLRRECLLPRPRRASSALPFARALDLGCAVGRFTFELTRVAAEVLGVDSSAAFIQTARRLSRGSTVVARVPQTGLAHSRLTIRLPATVRNRAANFLKADAMRLGQLADSPFDLVAAINLICRLPSPRPFLLQLPKLVAPRGQLLLASPFSWLKQYTPPAEWVSSEEVQDLLAPEFYLARRRDLPFLLREHRRKYQFVISEVLTFVRRTPRSASFSSQRRRKSP